MQSSRCLRDGVPVRAIAACLDRNRSTIVRERKRGLVIHAETDLKEHEVYSCECAQINADTNETAHGPGLKIGSDTNLAKQLVELLTGERETQILALRNWRNAAHQKRLLTLPPMVRDGANADITPPETKGNTALCYSCALENWSITEWLVNHGANVNAVANKGATPLVCVGSDNGMRIRALLKSHGAKRHRSYDRTRMEGILRWIRPLLEQPILLGQARSHTMFAVHNNLP